MSRREMTREELAALVARERAAQGLPPTIRGIEAHMPAARFILMAMALDEPQATAEAGRRRADDPAGGAA